MVAFGDPVPESVEVPPSQADNVPEILGFEFENTIISSVEAGQAPLLIVHLRVELAPIVKLVIPELGEVGLVTTAVPEITDQAPVPTTGVFATRVVEVRLHKDWSGPAFAAVGGLSIVMIFVLEFVDAQTPLCTIALYHVVITKLE